MLLLALELALVGIVTTSLYKISTNLPYESVLQATKKVWD